MRVCLIVFIFDSQSTIIAADILEFRKLAFPNACVQFISYYCNCKLVHELSPDCWIRELWTERYALKPMTRPGIPMYCKCACDEWYIVWYEDMNRVGERTELICEPVGNLRVCHFVALPVLSALLENSERWTHRQERWARALLVSRGLHSLGFSERCWGLPGAPRRPPPLRAPSISVFKGNIFVLCIM